MQKTTSSLGNFLLVTSLLIAWRSVMAQAPTNSPVNAAVASGLQPRLDQLLARMSTQEKIKQLFYKTDGNARLGIPQFTGSDGPHGIGNQAPGWSCFPVTLAMAATWDPELIQQVGHAIAMEQASRGRDRLAGPTLDLLSDPRNGRAPETVGEDPYLAGRISVAFLRGMNKTPVFGTIKHYNLNTYEAGRETNNYTIDQRSLVEFWGDAWRHAVQDGGALSVMCAYNRVNGDKCAENFDLIKTILRDDWGFAGYTMCDWGGFDHTVQAMRAQLDFCEGNEHYLKDLPGLIASGQIPMAWLNRAVRDVLRVKILSGMVDGRPTVPATERDSPAHRKLVYECGLRSLVLLKNEGNILPLRPDIKNVAVIGPNAARLPLDGRSSSAVIPSYTISLLQGLQALLGTNRVLYAPGCAVNDTNRDGFAAAKAIARQSDVVIFAGGLDNTVEGEEYFIKGDRLTGTVELPGEQNELIHELAAVNSNLVLVVISGGPCAVHPVIHDLKGLLYAFYPGQEGGRALADVLCGRANPSGKLPVTLPRDDAQLPPRDTDFRDAVVDGFGYRWFDNRKLPPEFAFGSGLSYTTFAFRHLRVSTAEAPAGQPIQVTVEVENTGSRAGEEVVQLYLAARQLRPALPMPVKQLKGFAKVRLDPGQTCTVTFSLTPDELYVFDPVQDRYLVPTGDYTVMVGGSSDDLPLHGAFTLEPAAERPDLQVVNIRTVPAYPKIGEPVSLLASILNRGTGPVPVGVMPMVKFWVNDRLVAGAENVTAPIPAGGMALACSPATASGLPLWRARPGQFQIRAEVSTVSAATETNPLNNACHASLLLPGGKVIAQAGKPVAAGRFREALPKTRR